jgi:hypothetical protein
VAPDFRTTGLVGGSLPRKALNGAEHDVCRSAGNVRCWVWRTRASIESPRPANDKELEAKWLVDALFTARPFSARRIARTLSVECFPIDASAG